MPKQLRHGRQLDQGCLLDCRSCRALLLRSTLLSWSSVSFVHVQVLENLGELWTLCIASQANENLVRSTSRIAATVALLVT